MPGDVIVEEVVVVDVHGIVGVVGDGEGRRGGRGEGGHGGGDEGEELGAIHGQRTEFTRGNSVGTDIVTANAERVFVTGARDGDSDLSITGVPLDNPVLGTRTALHGNPYFIC